MGQWATASALIATYRSYYSIIHFSPHTHLTQITVVSAQWGRHTLGAVARGPRRDLNETDPADVTVLFVLRYSNYCGRSNYVTVRSATLQ